MRGVVAGVLAASILMGTFLAAPPARADLWTCGARTYGTDPFLELVSNGGFESDLAGWWVTGGTALPTISTTIVHSGAKSAHVDDTGYPGNVDAAQDLPPSFPSVYALSYWFYVDTWGTGGMLAVMLVRNWDPSTGANDAVSWVGWTPPNTMTWRVWVPLSGGGITRTYPMTVGAQAWHRVDTLVDGTVGIQCLYVDGAFVDSASVSPGATYLPENIIFGDVTWTGNPGPAYYDDLSIRPAGSQAPDYQPVNPQPPGLIRIGESLPASLSIGVRNPMNASANLSATVAFFNESTPSTPFATFSLPPLVAGGSAGPFTATWRSPATPGTYRILADVDYYNDVIEWDETNNRYTWTAIVYPPPVTTLALGTPSFGGTFVTSSTPLSLSVQDRSGTGILRTEYRVDGVAWQDYASPFTLAGEGNHLVEWFSEDNVGNVEATQRATLTVDDTPPTTVLTLGAPSYGTGFVTSSTPITLAATDGGMSPVGVEGISYRVDAGGWQPYAAPFTLAGEGAHTVVARAADLLGNTEGNRSWDLTVDDTGPDATVSAGSPSFVSTDTWITSSTPVSITAADRGAIPVGLDSVDYRVWNGSWSGWSPYSVPFQVPPEGRRYVEWRAADLLGNAGAGNASLIVDDTPPSVSVSLSGPSYASGGDTWITSASRILLSAVDGGAIPVGLGSLRCRTWFGTWAPWLDCGASIALSGDGRHFLEWEASDLLGNVRAGNASYIVDDTPPSSGVGLTGPSFVGAGTYVTSATQITATSSDGGVLPVGLAQLDCSIDGGVWSPYAEPFTLSGPDGARSVSCRGTDRLGNVGAPAVLSVILDNTPPTTTLRVPLGTLSVRSTFNLSAADAGCGVARIEYRIDGGAWVPYGAAFALPVGTHTVGYRAIDQLGNAELERTAVVVIENWKPIVALVFTVVLAFVAVLLAWRARRKRDAGWRSVLAVGIVFAAVEATTGLLSLFLAVLPIPPYLDLGTIVDVAILAAGLIVTALVYRRVRARAPTASAVVPPPPPTS